MTKTGPTKEVDSTLPFVYDPGMNEIIFFVVDAPEGGYCARALGESIFTEADTVDELRRNIVRSVSLLRFVQFVQWIPWFHWFRGGWGCP